MRPGRLCSTGLLAMLAIARGLADPAASLGEEPRLQAGAAVIDVAPPKFPVIVNGMFTERTADRVVDTLSARALVLRRASAPAVAIVVVDSCMMPRELVDPAKLAASKLTGIPTHNMLVSATHTHSAPSCMGALGSDPDPDYGRFLEGRITEAIVAANARLRPAKVGWTTAQAPDHTYNRRWILRPDKTRDDPFGDPTIRANMHPGYQHPDFVGPSGPVDPEVALLVVKDANNRPLALLANYSMHYFGSPMLSADYYGRFNTLIENAWNDPAGGEAAKPVVMMSQGTSGDLMWMDYGSPQRQRTLEEYSESLAKIVLKALKSAETSLTDDVPLVMKETTLTLKTRQASAERLAWARTVMNDLNGKKPTTQPQIYAREALLLAERPTRELKLQALRIGDAGIAAIPDEVFALTGLKIKAASPLGTTFTMELANGSEGYIPPPEQHTLGGYTTWNARTAGLEVQAEPRITEVVLTLLEQVSGAKRKTIEEAETPASRLLAAASPSAYYRLGDADGSRIRDHAAHGRHARLEPRVALALSGAGPEPFPGPRWTNRAAHFAGGRIVAPAPERSRFTIELLVWNGLPNDARPVTGYLASIGIDGDASAKGEHLGISGTHRGEVAGKLLVFNGDEGRGLLVGKTALQPRTWHHVAWIRDGRRVRVHLDGAESPEIEGILAVAGNDSPETRLFLGGRSDNYANLAGKLDEVVVFDRVLTPEEIRTHANAVRGSGESR